jgi:mRNA interferase HigB
MRILSRHTLVRFWEKHADIKAEQAHWASPEEIKRQYPSADPIPGNRMVFNIKGNSYRLIV